MKQPRKKALAKFSWRCLNHLQSRGLGHCCFSPPPLSRPFPLSFSIWFFWPDPWAKKTLFPCLSPYSVAPLMSTSLPGCSWSQGHSQSPRPRRPKRGRQARERWMRGQARCIYQRNSCLNFHLSHFKASLIIIEPTPFLRGFTSLWSWQKLFLSLFLAPLSETLSVRTLVGHTQDQIKFYKKRLYFNFYFNFYLIWDQSACIVGSARELHGRLGRLTDHRYNYSSWPQKRIL